MATVRAAALQDSAGNLFTGTVTFYLHDNSARVIPPGLYSAKVITATCTAGVLSQVLAAGTYNVLLVGQATKQFRIAVADSSATFDIETLITSGTQPLPSVEVGLPAGGALGAALVKKSTDDYDAEWAALPGGGDMLKATYDANADGIVDVAALANGVNLLCSDDATRHIVRVRLWNGTYVLEVVQAATP